MNLFICHPLFGFIPVSFESIKNLDLNKEKKENNQKKNSSFEVASESLSSPMWYIMKIGEQLSMDKNAVISHLKLVHTVSPGALLSMLLMVIAKELDKNYNDHISKADTVYVYSTTDSKIYSMPTSSVKKASFKYFAAFRSKEEAVFGIKMANMIRNFIFSNDRK